MVFEKYKVISPKEYAGKKISKQSKSEYPYSRRLNRLQTLDDFEYLVGQLFDKLKKDTNRLRHRLENPWILPPDRFGEDTLQNLKIIRIWQ